MISIMRSRAQHVRVRASVVRCVLLVIATATAACGGDQRRETATAESAGMEGMAGMNMTMGGSVELTSAQIRQFGVTFDTAKVRPLVAETRTTGVVTFDETRIVQVAPRFGGFVERLYVSATGQPVRRGEALLEIYSPELVAAQQELLVARDLQREAAATAVPGVPAASADLVESSRRRLRLWDVSDPQIDEVLRTGKARRTLTIYAPASGFVIEKRVMQGQATSAGEALYTIADLSVVWIDVQLREAEAAAVRSGSGAEIETAAARGRPLKGRVTYVYPTLDSASRSIRARVVVANSSGVLKPGMYATVRLATPGRSVLTVPSSAVLRTGDRDVVFVDMGGGELMPHEVALGASAGEYVEVLSGLEAGARVVTSPQFLLDSESNLGEVMKAMIGNMGAGGTDRPGGMADMPGMEMPAPVKPRR